MGNYNIENLTGEEIHRLWDEMPENERIELFEELKAHADCEELELEEGEEQRISDTVLIQKTNDGFTIKTDTNY